MSALGGNYIVGGKPDYTRFVGTGDGWYGIRQDNKTLTLDSIVDRIASSGALKLYTDKEKPMSAVQAARAKREEERVEKLLAAYDTHGLNEATNGAVYRFKFKPEDGDKTYLYAAIKADGRWHLTGRETRGFKTTEFIDWLVERDIQPTDVHPMF